MMLDKILSDFNFSITERHDDLFIIFQEAAKVVKSLNLKDIYIWAIDFDLEGGLCFGVNYYEAISKESVELLKSSDFKEIFLLSKIRDDIFWTGDWKYQDVLNKNINALGCLDLIGLDIKKYSDLLWNSVYIVDDLDDSLYIDYLEKFKYIVQEFFFSVREEAISKNELCREYMDKRLFFVIEHDDSLEEAIARNFFKTGRIII